MHEVPKSSLPTGLPPGWTFGRDLRCPQCKYNLRSLREPLCPECGFVFRWQQLLGVICPRCARPLGDESGNICRHCFLTLDWASLLGDADPHQQLEFEYSTRLARPYLHTLIETLNPWRFWNLQRVQFPPNRARLRIFAYISALLGVLGILAPLAATSLGWTYISPDDWLSLAALATIPSIVLSLFIRTFSRVETRRGRRPERPYRTYVYSITGFVWSGLVLLLGTLIACATNWIVTWYTHGELRAPSALIAFDLNKAINYYVGGGVSWQWHPVDIWFSVGVTAALLVVMLIWWPIFAVISIRRGLGTRFSSTSLIFLSVAAISVCGVLTVWANVIPRSELIQRLTRYLLP
ncbi:MAG: hypothetical protein AB7N71_00485 [Phycisphaerae bacterium]